MEALKNHTPGELLTALAYGEARGESLEGSAAVMMVVRNRVLHPRWWGRSWKEVMLKPWQFSCFNANDPNREMLIEMMDDPLGSAEDPEWREARFLVAGVFNGDIQDMTKGATHYHVTDMARPPMWASLLTPTAVIGRHSFYKTR